MAVNDNNPLYGSFTYGGAYSNCPSTIVGGVKTATLAGCTNFTAVSDNYWADFLFGTTSTYQLANYFVVHLRQTLESAYAQDDWKVTPKLTLNLGLRWEYGSPYSEQNNNISNFDPVTPDGGYHLTRPWLATASRRSPAAASTARRSSIPTSTDFSPRVGFAYAITSKTALRGGFGTGYVHYTRAGSGDILAINAPQAQFASVTQIAPTTTNHCATPLPAQIIATARRLPPATPPPIKASLRPGHHLQPGNRQHHLHSQGHPDSYVESYFLSVQRSWPKTRSSTWPMWATAASICRASSTPTRRTPLGFARPYANWPSDITEALNEFISNYNALQVRYEQRSVFGLTLLNSFTWEHALDNASASLEGNTPSPQDGNNIRGDYAQSDYNLPIANITSLVYELPVGRGRRFLSGRERHTRQHRGRMADQRHQYHAGRHALQSSPTRPMARRLSRRRFRPPTAAPTSIVRTLFPARRSRRGAPIARRQHRLRELHQLRGLRAAADQGRRRQCAQSLRHGLAQSRPHAGLL
jgi:hypothetical protein